MVGENNSLFKGTAYFAVTPAKYAVPTDKYARTPDKYAVPNKSYPQVIPRVIPNGSVEEKIDLKNKK